MAADWKNTKQYFITYSILINAAQHQGVATYQEIAQACGLPTAGAYMGSAVGGILGAISKNEIEHNRPFLSAIAVDVHGSPSEGLFTWAKELGAMSEDEDNNSFFVKEKNRIYEEWKITYRISRSRQ
jgi:hypothetical protein